jgi:hypothetical protein
MTTNTPIWQLTVGELTDLLRQIVVPAEPEIVVRLDSDERYVYGIKGIAKLLGCSRVQVHEYRRQGWIEPAIKQYGRKIMCDKDLALKLFGEKRKKYNKP